MRSLGILAALFLPVVVASPVAAVFNDVVSAPVTGSMTSIGGGWVDFDSDGDLDLVRSNWGSGGNLLLRNDGNEIFINVADAEFAFSGTSNKAGVAWADFDADGDSDPVIVAGGATRLLRYDGNQNFVIVGTLGGSGDRTGNWVDWDGDGDLDIFAAGTSTSQGFRNDGGAFVPFTPPGLAVPAQASTFIDYDGDGDPDCYTSSEPKLLRNDGNAAFVEVSSGTVGNLEFSLGGVWADFDLDGDLDLVQTVIDQFLNNHLFRNDGGDSFVDVTADAGDLALPNREWVAVTLGDYDLDGDQDLFMGEQLGTGAAALLRNDGGLVFTDVTADELPALPADDFQYNPFFGDMDLDGDPDLYVGLFGVASRLLRNDQETRNHWLRVVPRGGISETSGIGSWVELTAGGVTQIRYISGGVGWGTLTPHPHVVFGLGTETVASVTIRWPSGRTTTLSDVAADGTVLVYEEGAPAIQTSTYAPGTTFDFVLDPGDFAVTGATLVLRPAGTADPYTPIAMSFIAGPNVFQAGVPSGFAVADGIEYFVDYQRTGGSPQRIPYGSVPESPAFLPAALPNTVIPEVPAAGQYVMFGLPFVPTNADPGAVLGDELGAYDPTRWRFGNFDPLLGNNGGYLEFPGTSPFAPGRGFWLIQAAPVAVGSTGQSTNTVGGTNLWIERGWNQIAHPYQFPVALSDVDFSGAPDVEQTINGWDGTGYVTDNELAAWGGYFMFNAAAAAQPIGIPGVTSTASPVPSPRAGEGWRLVFHTDQLSSRDRGNEIGFASEATDDADRLDRHAPPAMPGTIRTYFEIVASDGVPHELNRDLRSEGSGAVWDLVIEAPSEETVRLSVEELGEIPADLDVVLIALDTWAVSDLRERSSYALPGGRTHRFRIAAGSGSFVESVQAGEGSAAPEFALGLGYPNPLASSTKIGFALPAESNVQLAVYDVTGRKVRTLVSGTRSAGRHVAEWNAQDEAGRAVAPGVYFVKMLAGSHEETRKLTVLR